MSEVKKYLEAVVEAFEKFKMPKPPEFRYRSIEDFVLKCGRDMGARSPLSCGIPRGTPKQCFCNAYRHVIAGKLEYCEGFATSGIMPVLHAWLIDLDGNVIDPTWEDGVEYYGVQFDTEFVVRTVLARGCYGVIDNWELKWPLLRGDETWKRKF